MSKSSFVFVILQGTVQFTNCTIVRDRLQLRITVYFKRVFIFSIAMAATDDLMVSRAGPKCSTSNSNGTI